MSVLIPRLRTKLSVVVSMVVLVFGIALLEGAASIFAQVPAHAASAPEVHVKASFIAESKTIKPGEPFLLGVSFEIEPHWHIYYKEAGEAGFPTQIEWVLPPGFKAGELLWQKPHKFSDSGITTYGYSDKTLIAAQITPPADLAVGKPVSITANLKWLSCKDLCLPGKDQVTIALPVEAKPPDKSNAALFNTVGFKDPVSTLTEDHKNADGEQSLPGSSTDSGTGPSEPVAGNDSSQTSSTGTGAVETLPSEANGTGTKVDATTGSGSPEHEKAWAKLDEILKDEPGQSQNVLYYIGFALVGGFILNFMPCVLPVIAIKVMSFIEQANDDPKRVKLLGMTFSAGIMSAFLALALIVLAIRAAGKSVGWGFQFQYPGFVILMCVIVLVLSLSLFGLFYVSFSAGQDNIDKLAQKEGFVGTYFKGVLATTLSTPCTAPFLGSALGFAFAQPDWVVISIFLASSLGMSLPYLLFTAMPGLMKYCPKPGVWMEKFKESMGFVLLATVVWLLGVLGSQVGAEGVMWTGFFLVAVALSCWIISRYTDLTSDSARKMKVWTIAGLVSAAGFYFFVWNQPSISVALAGDGNKSVEKASSRVEGGINWEPFTVEGLVKAIEENKTIFLDFTADWCLTCKANEKLFLNTEPVKEKFKQLNAITMKADWTSQDADVTRLLKKFNRSGVPLYVVFPASRAKERVVLPEVINQNMVLEALDKAGPSKG